MRIKLLIALLISVSITVYSQPKDTTKKRICTIGVPVIRTVDSTLIADETNMIYTKTGAKIITSSEDIFQKISLKWGEEFKSIHITYKKDRYGKYKQYSICLSQATANNIYQWAKKNL